MQRIRTWANTKRSEKRNFMPVIICSPDFYDKLDQHCIKQKETLSFVFLDSKHAKDKEDAVRNLQPDCDVFHYEYVSGERKALKRRGYKFSNAKFLVFNESGDGNSELSLDALEQGTTRDCPERG